MSGDVSSRANRALSRMQGRVSHTKTYPGCSLESVDACQGKVAVCKGVRVLSSDVFALKSQEGC